MIAEHSYTRSTFCQISFYDGEIYKSFLRSTYLSYRISSRV